MNKQVAEEIVWTSLQMCDTNEARRNTMNAWIEKLGIEFVSEVVRKNHTVKYEETA